MTNISDEFEKFWKKPSVKSPYGDGDGLYSPASLAESRKKQAAKLVAEHFANLYAERLRVAEKEWRAYVNVSNELSEKLRVAESDIKEAYDMLRSTSYTELENGAVKMCGNEWPWIPRTIEILKQGLKKIRGEV